MLSEMSDREFAEWHEWFVMNQEVTKLQTGAAPLSYELAWAAVFTPEKK